MLNWRTITSSTSPKFLVKGTELATAQYGPHGLFQLCEVRTLGADGFPDVRYVVRNALTVTDAEVREGIRSRIVHHAATLDDAIAYCDSQP
jgi:hypothetical protein